MALLPRGMRRIPKRPRRALLALGSAFAAAAVALWVIPAFGTLGALRDNLENVLYDLDWSMKYAFEAESGADRPLREPNIVVVDVDETSLDRLGPFNSWPRTHHAEVVRRLSEGGASAIVFDILFQNADFGRREAERAESVLSKALDAREMERLRPVLRGGFNADSALIEEVRRSGRVVVGATGSPKSAYSQSAWKPFATEEWFESNNPASATIREDWRSPWGWALLDNVFPELSQAAARVGLTNVVPDPDGVHRREPLLHSIPFPADSSTGPTRQYPVLALQTALLLTGASPDELVVEPGRAVRLPPPLRLFRAPEGIAASLPGLTPGMIARLRASKGAIDSLPPGSDELRATTPVVLRRGQDGELEADVEDGQTLEGELLRKAMESDGEGDLALEDEDGEEVEICAYTARTLREARERAAALKPGRSAVLSQEIRVRRESDGTLVSNALLLKGETLRELLDLPEEALEKLGEGDTLFVGRGLEVPVDERGAVRIGFAGKGMGSFKTVSYASVLAGEIDDGFYQGKVFVLGSTASGLFDIVSAPGDRVFPGIFVHANLLENILNGHATRVPPPLSEALVVVLAALLVALLAWTLPPFVSGPLAVALALVGFSLGFKEFVESGVFHGIVDPLVAAVLAFLLSMALRYLVEAKDRRHAVAAFKSYISPELIDRMLETGEKPALGGEKKLLTAYFTDIQSFSTFSEKIGDAARLVELINEYLTAMTDILLKNGGTLDKYEGDAIIAFFGAPVTVPDHARKALLAALAMQKRLAELRAKWSSEGDKWPDAVREMRMRIGINSGEIVTGNMGSSIRMNYTMMGDDVNLAARLESGAKQYGVYVLASEATMKLAGDDVVGRPIDRLRVVGKSEPVLVFEPLCERSELTPELERLLALWNEARAAYEAMEWDRAEALFAQCQELEPNHPDRQKGCRTTPSHVFAARCREFREHPPVAPGEKWDAVYTAKSK